MKETKYVKDCKDKKEDSRHIRLNYPPIYHHHHKKIYVIVGKFWEEGYKFFKVQLKKQYIDCNGFDFGKSDSRFKYRIDYGDSVLTDYIDKNFKVYTISSNEYDFVFNEYFTSEIQIPEDEIQKDLKLQKIIGYIYPFSQVLEFKNVNFVIIYDGKDEENI